MTDQPGPSAADPSPDRGDQDPPAAPAPEKPSVIRVPAEVLANIAATDLPALSPEQRARAEALEAARELLLAVDESPGFGRSGAKPAPVVSELMEVADYILTGIRVDLSREVPVVYGLTADRTDPTLLDGLARVLRATYLDEAPVAGTYAGEGGLHRDPPPAPPTVTDPNAARGGAVRDVPEQRTPPTAPPADPPTPDA